MRTIWVAARRNLDPPIPECPEGFSEPRYASLVFDTHCMACGAGRATWKYSYAARVRFCGACWKANVILGSKLAKQMDIKNDMSIMSVVFNLLPEARDRAHYHSRGQGDQHSGNKFYEPEFLAMVEQYKKVQSEGARALKEFVKKRRLETKARLEFDSVLRQRERAQNRTKEKADEQVMYDHADAVKEKLRQLGYTHGDLPRWTAGFEKLILQPRPLTTRSWNIMRPKLIEMIDAERARQAEEAFKRKWYSRLNKLRTYYNNYLQEDRALNPERSTLPKFDVARKLPCMAALLTAAEDPAEDLPEEQFAVIEAILLQELEEKYRLPAKHFLAELVRETMRPSTNAATSCDAKTSKKTKASVSKRKGKGKGKKQDVNEDSESDVDYESDSEGSVDPEAQDVDAAADTTLLNALTSIFECRSCERYHSGARHMTCNELLAHWQDYHDVPPWEADAVCVSYSFDMPRLLVALRLPPDTTLSDIEQLLGASSTPPKCSHCQVFSRPDRTLGNLLYHIRDSHWRPHDASATEKEFTIDLGVESSLSAACHSAE
ncbi:hypothetical protein K466DRAFT_663886 [Polyporus arcularius HHB13444]|uniref:Uncharacterized protein n=1 Tax=Polyporus arcularius HHB13444 TaxID=1314778 RepID=A0A5C3P985_9APHY|nr:hypothetical protein K466DRAFT_663886 [Polyporus arcularius HHB13444]